MIASTEIPVDLEARQAGDPLYRRQGEPIRLGPVQWRETRTTAEGEPDKMVVKSSVKDEMPRWSARFVTAALPREIVDNSTPLQIWEGTVLDIDPTNAVMRVVLDAKIGQIPRHTAEIDLQWVSEQDHDLLRNGAIFYLTLYKRTKPTVENSQELRFRRRPAWSSTQLKRIDHDAAALRSKMKVLPSAR